MDKDQLEQILSSDYDQSQWIDLLQVVFHTGDVFKEPQKIVSLPGNLSKEAYRLGTFVTVDSYEIGVFEVHLKENVALHRNRVGVRNLLRRYYKQLDGVFAVFKQGDTWRFSFISQLRDWDEEQEEWVEKETEPKRFTYLLGEGEAVKTARDRFYQLVEASQVSFEDIKEAFSVEKLNKEFYKKVVSSFYDLLGVKEPGRGGEQHPHLLELPSVSQKDKQTHQEFAVRLIGRIVFCWFLKFKKSEQGNPIITDEALSSDAVTDNFYHQKLERLFFQVLNTQKEDRRNDLPEKYNDIPFLNGGLFEPHYQDFYKVDESSGISKNLNTLKIPDEWFRNLFEVLEQYNFTIDENSVEDADVSVDPEMLGRIFENLLAEIDPASGDSARKATGSYYTPREIVDYMVDESLNKYLSKKTGINERRLMPLFKLDDDVNHSITAEEKEQLIRALNDVKVLDPACGSGAFPMGILQKMVRVLEKIDPESKRWKDLQLDKIPSAIIRRILRKRLDDATVEYARKLGIIQHSIYGVDIQPIAAEISKLRCFLSLVVDEQVDEFKDNWNIEPLPNLEFKFLAADSLKSLPKEDSQTVDLFGSADLLQKLGQIRDDYLQAYGEDKEILKEQFTDIQDAILDKELKGTGRNKSDRAVKLSSWEPFSDSVTGWFDPEWMFGVEQFDIAIGNPPYGGDKIENNLKKKLGLRSKDPYGAFLARFLPEGSKKSPLVDNGLLCFIVSDTFMTINSHFELREKMMDNYIHKMIRVHPDTFGATVNTAIILCERNEFPRSEETDKSICKFDNAHKCLMADLTQVSIHKQHERFLELLEKTVQYEHPLQDNQNGGIDAKEDILYSKGENWLSEFNSHYAIYSLRQVMFNEISHLPFFVSSPSIAKTLYDVNVDKNEVSFENGTSTKFRRIRRNGKDLRITYLGDDYKRRGGEKQWFGIGVSKVISGIKTGSNKKYLRSLDGDKYSSVDESRILTFDESKELSKNEKQNGIKGEKCFLPFDMGKASDVISGWLPNYYQPPTDIYIDWSVSSVKSMKNESHSDLANWKFRCRDGIVFSKAGQYAPTFRVSTGSILDSGSNGIFSNNFEVKELLGILCSKFIRFVFNTYINHTVNAQVDDIKILPFPLDVDFERIHELTSSIIDQQKDNLYYDYSSHEQLQIDLLVYRSFGLTYFEIEEVENWYARRYPKLVEAQKENLTKQGKPTDYLELYAELEKKVEL